MKNNPILNVGLAATFIFFEGIVMANEKQVQLPSPSTKGTISVEEALQKRRSQRTFAKKELSLAEIGQIAWAGQGVTDQRWVRNSLRTAPSAGALYPLEIYILTKNGLFHYLPDGHKMDKVTAKDLRKELAVAALGQSPIKEAPMVMVICAVYERVTAKYSGRGIIYTHLEAGHAAQNILLQAVALGLGAVPVGAFMPDDVQKVLKVPKEQVPLYIIPIGYAE